MDIRDIMLKNNVKMSLIPIGGYENHSNHLLICHQIDPSIIANGTESGIIFNPIITKLDGFNPNLFDLVYIVGFSGPRPTTVTIHEVPDNNSAADYILGKISPVK